MAQQFTGRKLVVIGGSSGIGRQVAADVVAADGSAVIVGHHPNKVEQTVSELSATGTAWGITADLRDPAELDKVQAQLAGEHADATLLVNAAGVFKPLPFLEHTAADYDGYLELNRAMFFLTQTVAREMAAGGRGGAIVNIGSMWARQAIAATPSSAYSMAKAGLHALTQHLALELAGHRIRINAVSPAVVSTPIYQGFIPPAEVGQALAGFNDFHPLGRIGTTTDVAAVITFLLSDRASWVTADPKVGEARFAVDTHWQGASRSRAHVSSYHLGGQEYPHQFVIDADEPPGLLGDDTAPNPQELLLAGLNACMTAGIVATTAARGIALTSLRIRTSGQLDLRGYLGLDPDVNPGYDRVDVHIEAISPAADADLHAAITDAVRHSPNFNNFRRAISVTPTITTGTGT